MTFPLYFHEVFGYQAGLVTGTLIGIGFGFVLERSGFGRAPVLAAQFYGSDMRVLKVMFTAIVTALAGMTLLAGAGLLDLEALTVPETFLWPQLAGGLLLGAGFIVSGYCPGTSVVATASGNLDGFAAFLGVIAGSVAFGLFFPSLPEFYQSGNMGMLRLPDLFGLPQAVLAAAVITMAMGAFFFAEWVERRLARARRERAPVEAPATRNRVLAGVTVAAVLGILALAVPPRVIPQATKPITFLDPLNLARDLVENPLSLYLVDLRDPVTCSSERIPGAICLTPEDPQAAFLATLPPTRRLVLYAEDTLATLPEAAQRFSGEVTVLDGGFKAFSADILKEPAVPLNPTPADVERFRLLSALHGYFTGSAVEMKPVPLDLKPVQMERPLRKGGGC